MQKNIVETIVGFLVLLIAAWFMVATYETGNLKMHKDGYIINANFDRIDGIVIGSDVKVSGVKVGIVVEQTLDLDNYLAHVRMKIDKNIKLPVDTSAEIISNGLIGEKYISLAPGAEDEIMQEGAIIEVTQSSVNLESLIGKFIFGSAEAVNNNKEQTEETTAQGVVHEEGNSMNYKDKELVNPHSLGFPDTSTDSALS